MLQVYQFCNPHISYGTVRYGAARHPPECEAGLVARVPGRLQVQLRVAAAGGGAQEALGVAQGPVNVHHRDVVRRAAVLRAHTKEPDGAYVVLRRLTVVLWATAFSRAP